MLHYLQAIRLHVANLADENLGNQQHFSEVSLKSENKSNQRENGTVCLRRCKSFFCFRVGSFLPSFLPASSGLRVSPLMFFSTDQNFTFLRSAVRGSRSVDILSIGALEGGQPLHR